jgi:hypothetical protein
MGSTESGAAGGPGRLFLAGDVDTKVPALSTESIASSASSHTQAPVQCASCGAPLARDQRYCLECGERLVPMSSVLRGELPPGQAAAAATPPTAPFPPGAAPPASGAPERNNTLTVIAGVGVLLLALGVGVLIGRAGSPKPSAAPAQVISVASPTSAAGGTTGGEAAFTGDWPSGTNGYTVQLQTLPESGTSASAVEAAKSAASAKGAKSVGALKSEEFASLSPGSYVIYSGVYHKKAEADKALSALKKSFPAAKVIAVSSSGSSGASTTSPKGSGSSSSPGKPAKVAPGLKGVKGKTYEEKSKNVPNEVEF